MNFEDYFDKLPDGTTWPALDSDLAWQMRHANAKDGWELRYLAAQTIEAYVKLARSSQKRRNQVCAELRKQERERA